MPTADFWPALPANPTWIFVVCLVIVVGFFLLRGYSATLQTEITGLRAALNDQARRHADDVSALNAKIDRLEQTTEEARSERHRLRGELAKTRLALDIVRRLQRECTCGALAPLEEILSNLAEHGDI